MHDYFDILGVSSDARPAEIRRACCRRVPSTHPDIQHGEDAPARRRATASKPRGLTREWSDVSIDFMDASALVDAMRAAFFGSCATTSTR